MSETVTETAKDRLDRAVTEQDEAYIEGFKRGVELAEANADPSEDASQAVRDGHELREEQKSDPIRNRLLFAPHPMGGIGVTLYGSDGEVNQARLEMDTASVASTHLTALITMMYQTAYMLQQQAQEQASSIVIPGR